MTQEEKQLLLVDLSARMTYGVVYHRNDGANIKLNAIDVGRCLLNYTDDIEERECKPYLRPMESMTERETYIFRQDILNDVEARCIHSLGCGKYSLAFAEANDWLNAHHFDYRDLIGKGLALEAPVDMYKL